MQEREICPEDRALVDAQEQWLIGWKFANNVKFRSIKNGAKWLRVKLGLTPCDSCALTTCDCCPF